MKIPCDTSLCRNHAPYKPIIKVVVKPSGIVFRRIMQKHYCKKHKNKLRLETVLTPTIREEMAAGLATFGAMWPERKGIKLEFCEVSL